FGGGEVGEGRRATTVGHGGAHSCGLVERQVHQIRAAGDAPAVHLDDLPVGIDPRAVPAHDPPVALDPPLADQLLTPSAAADTGGGKHLLQADAAGDVDE